MSKDELAFCEEYERRLNDHKVMSLILPELSHKGKEFYDKLTSWLTDHLNIYLELIK